MANTARSFELRILKASWGLAIDLIARVILSAGSGADIQVGTRTWLRVLPPLPPPDLEWLATGLGRMALLIEATTRDPVIVEIQRVDYVPTDYQPEAMAAAIIGWVSEEFDLDPPDVDVTFDKEANRYVFSF